MDSTHDWQFLEPWQTVLLCRLQLEPLQPDLTPSQTQQFGWLTLDLSSLISTTVPSGWLVEWFSRLREALELFALAAQCGSSVWSKVLGVHGLPEEELHVRYRFVAGNQFREILKLLVASGEIQESSAPFTEAKQRVVDIMKTSGKGPATAPIQISLVVKPEEWNDCLLQDISAFYTSVKAYNDTTDRQGVQYTITEVQLDTQADFAPIWSLPDWLHLLGGGVPVEFLSLAVYHDWTEDNIHAFVQAADNGCVGSISLMVSSSSQLDAFLCATRRTSHLKTVEINAIEKCAMKEHQANALASSVRSLRWLLDAPLLTIPLGVDSLELSSSASDWFSTLRACGPQLRSFCLRGSASKPDAIDAGAIASLCPNLTHLELNGVSIRSLDELTTRFESHRCQLQSLALKDVDLDDAGSVDRLGTALTQARSPVSQQLVEFTWLPRASVVSCETVETFGRVLESNPYLRYLSLRSKDPSVDQAKYARHHLRRLPGYKWAFLSVVPYVAGNRLNRDVLEQIFAYADIGERRRVVFQF